MLDLAHDLKAKKRSGIQGEMLKGKNIVLLFDKTSTRTRCSFEVACHDEGAHVTYLDSKSSQVGKKESIEDSAKVLGRFLTVSSIAATSRRWSRILQSTRHTGMERFDGHRSSDADPGGLPDDRRTYRKAFIQGKGRFLRRYQKQYELCVDVRLR